MEIAGFTWKQGKVAEGVAKTAKAPVAASEQSPRSKRKVNYAVDWDAVQSEKYAHKFGSLSGSDKANKAVCTRARWALNNRDGAKTEEIYAVDMRTGVEIARITDQHFPQGVKRTTQFDRALKEAGQNGADIMLIHNHPASSPPSIGELNALLPIPGARGIVVGHDGSVYWYTSPREKIPQFEFDVAILRYKSYTYSTAHEKVLEDFSEKYGFVFARL